ncbi:MAG: YceI family protein [Paludibacteraceae bacterium]|nr:YceI family protein [Paludibacteraceae bacterium]
MKKLLLVSALTMYSLLGYSQITTWTNDPAHSRLGFVVKHLTISEIEGRFSEFNVTVTTLKPDYSDANIDLKANVKSINTDVEMRDNHLRSADFFDAEKYPSLTFKSTALVKKSKTKAKLYGELSFHGVTKPVVLDVTFFGSVVNPMNNKKTVGFQINGVIKRSDFNLGGKFPESIIENNIRIIANVEFSPSN